MLLKIPNPLLVELVDPHPSPVPIYMVPGALGSKAMQVTVMLLQMLETNCQVLVLLVISLLYHKPPVTAPAHIFLPLLTVGSTAKALVLPARLFGPLLDQVVLVVPGIARDVSCLCCLSISS